MRLLTTFVDGDHRVKLIQRTNGLFRVVYGQQLMDNLDYAEAYKEFGSCVFHSLASAGKLNNPGE